MTLASGRSTTLAASSGPPSSTSRAERRRDGARTKRRSGLDLEHRDGVSLFLASDSGQSDRERGIVDELAAALAADAKALVEMDQIGRGIDYAPPAASNIARRKAKVEPLPLVPATWITGRPSPLRMIERRKQALHAIKRQIDARGMQRQQPRQIVDVPGRKRRNRTLRAATSCERSRTGAGAPS